MSNITEETVNGLKDVIGKLESRVEDLESRFHNNGSGQPKSLSEQMRIILMGPPGSGVWLLLAQMYVCSVEVYLTLSLFQ